MAVERRSSLRKAAAVDVVAALTTGTQSDNVAEAEQGSDPAQQFAEPTVPSPATETQSSPAPRRKRRMLPFSSKIELNLRDEMDDYLAEHDITIIDFLDQAIRDRLSK